MSSRQPSHPHASRAEAVRALALQDEAARADADYRRLREAYLTLVRDEPTNDVALAMVGADMDRAHARLQALAGLPRLPFALGPGRAIRSEAKRGAGERL